MTGLSNELGVQCMIWPAGISDHCWVNEWLYRTKTNIAPNTVSDNEERPADTSTPSGSEAPAFNKQKVPTCIKFALTPKSNKLDKNFQKNC